MERQHSVASFLKHLKDIKMKDQGPDVVVLTHLCHSLELPTATVAGGLKKAKLVEQIVPCWAEIFPPSRDVDQALEDASLQELRQVRDGVNGEPFFRTSSCNGCWWSEKGRMGGAPF